MASGSQTSTTQPQPRRADPGLASGPQAHTYQMQLPPVPPTPPATDQTTTGDPGLQSGSQSAPVVPRQRSQSRTPEPPTTIPPPGQRTRNPISRGRSRSPPRRPNQTQYVEHLKTSQGQHANDVYFAQLVDLATRKQQFDPLFTYAEGSKKTNRIKGKHWDDIMFDMSVGVHDDDLTVLKSPTASSTDLQEHLSFMIANARGKTEVNIRNLSADERN